MKLGKVIDVYELKRKGYKIEDTSKRDTMICLSSILIFAIIVVGISVFIFFVLKGDVI